MCLHYLYKCGIFYNKVYLIKKREDNMGLIFGTYLRLLRIDRGMSLRQVEKITKISNSYLSQIEKGKRDIPTFKILSRLADAYGVKVTDLIENAVSQEGNKKAHSGNIAPNVEFILRVYEILSERRKETLKDFLLHLEQQEQKER